MASAIMTRAKLEIAEADVDLAINAKTKVILLKSTYVPNVDTHDLVDNAGAGDPVDEEADCTGYTRGYGGADRQVPATRVWNRDDVNNRVEYDHADVTWTALGGAANNTVGFVGHIVEDFLGVTGNDAESLMVAADDVNDVATNGGDIVYAPNAEGIIQI